MTRFYSTAAATLLALPASLIAIAAATMFAVVPGHAAVRGADTGHVSVASVELSTATPPQSTSPGARA